MTVNHLILGCSASDPSNPNAVVSKTPNMATFPGAPKKPVITDVTDSTVHLAWKPSEHEGASPVSSFIVEYFCYDTGEVSM